MAHRLPPLNQLRSFEVTARHLSVTRAADELAVTHGAVSHQIRALEDFLGFSLFLREKGRLRLSPEGAALVPAVSNAFEQIGTAVANLTRTAATGTLTISCVPALLACWLIPRLPRFSARHPAIQITCIPSNDDESLHSRDVDVCILYGDGHWSDCWIRRLASFDLFPVCSPALAEETRIRCAADLAAHVLIHADDGREWQSWLAAADATHLARGRHHFMTSAQLAMEAAAAGQGIALGDTITSREAVAAGRLVRPLEMAIPAVFSYYVGCRKEMRAAPLIGAFVSWLDEEISHTLANADRPAAPPTGAQADVRR